MTFRSRTVQQVTAALHPRGNAEARRTRPPSGQAPSTVAGWTRGRDSCVATARPGGAGPFPVDEPGNLRPGQGRAEIAPEVNRQTRCTQPVPGLGPAGSGESRCLLRCEKRAVRRKPGCQRVGAADEKVVARQRRPRGPGPGHGGESPGAGGHAPLPLEGQEQSGCRKRVSRTVRGSAGRLPAPSRPSLAVYGPRITRWTW